MAGPAGPDRAGPGRARESVRRRKYRGSLRPRSHRSQGPIGPKAPSVPQDVHGSPPGIPGNPYMLFIYYFLIDSLKQSSSIAPSISSTASKHTSSTAPSIIDHHRFNTFDSMEFHWNSTGSNGIPLNPMEFHWIQWNSNGSNGIPLGPMEFHSVQWSSIGSIHWNFIGSDMSLFQLSTRWTRSRLT